MACVLHTMWKLFSSGWVPQSDQDWIEWKRCNEFNPQKSNAQKDCTKEILAKSLSMWKTSKNKDIWAMAAEIFILRSENNNCGDRTLSKLLGVGRDCLTQMNKHFKAGWIPSEDSEYILWRDEYLRKEENHGT